MRVEWKAPVSYVSGTPMFDSNGHVTQRVMAGVENVMAAYTEVARLAEKYMDHNPCNYSVDSIFVVGSGARTNFADSDIDIMLIAPKLDNASCDNAKMMLSAVFFNDRPKQEAIDVFIRSRDKYPDRPSMNITSEVADILRKYNEMLC
ncbi:MAG TPA: hypothetical protein VJI12_04805 [archaeon]|nr:hypothetical protein [archaeon]